MLALDTLFPLPFILALALPSLLSFVAPMKGEGLTIKSLIGGVTSPSLSFLPFSIIFSLFSLKIIWKCYSDFRFHICSMLFSSKMAIFSVSFITIVSVSVCSLLLQTRTVLPNSVMAVRTSSFIASNNVRNSVKIYSFFNRKIV